MKGRERAAGQGRTFKRMWAYMKPFAGRYFFGIAGTAGANLIINACFAGMLIGITRGVIALNSRVLAESVSRMAFVTAGMCLLVFTAGRALINATMKALDCLRTALFDHLLALPVSEIESRHSGDLLSRATNDARLAGNVYTAGFQQLTSVALTAAGCALYMVRLDPRIGLMGILMSSIPLAANVPFTTPMRRIAAQIQERRASLTATFSDIIQGAALIRHYCLASTLCARATASSEDLRKASMRRIRLESVRVLSDELSQMATLLFMVYASYRAVESPALIPLVVAVAQLTNPIKYLFSNLGKMLSDVQSNLSAADRVLEVLDTPPEPREYPSAAPSRLPGPASNQREPGHCGEEPGRDGRLPPTALEVDRVSFTYPGSQEQVLSDVSFAVSEGATMALVGPSGGGKSTLIKVLLGLYPPASGDIRAFGKSLFGALLQEWRACFSYVPQDAFLFAGTVYDNILGGKDDPGHLRVEEAARLANALDFIRELPGVFQATVGERGANLSGGQRQRIAIARAVLKGSPILLLDEATSALDSESESLVQEALERLMRDRTTIVIAHRLSTVRNAGEILYIEGGKIVERGTHDSLMARDSRYRRLVEEGSIAEGSTIEWAPAFAEAHSIRVR